MVNSEQPPQPRRSRKKKLPPIVSYLRTIGAAAELFGWGVLMLADWFWVGVFAIYLGFALLALDVWFEPDWKLKGVVWGVILLFAAAFSWGIVFVKGPLPVTAFETDGEYPVGTVISGISWKPQFTELNVGMENPTDRVYEDLNVVISPNSAVAAIAQTSSISDVSFEDKNGTSSHMVDLDLGTGSSKVIPLVLLATDAGYRVRCGRLPAHTQLRIVMALTNIKWNPQPRPRGISPEEALRASNYIFRLKAGDLGTYWLGYRDGDVYGPRPRPTSSEWLKIEGDYTVGHRHRTTSQRVLVGGKITTGQQ